MAVQSPVMLENQIEHTFIVTADANSIRLAQYSPIAFAILQSVLLLNGMTKEDRKTTKDKESLYYSRKIKL